MSWIYDVYGSYGRESYGPPQARFPNRSGWKQKSDSAEWREREAKELFDAFYAKCIAMDATTTSFPVTEEVVGPEVHLTALCFTAFRKYVTAKGCKVQRREISVAEKMSLPREDIRRVKQYAISVTVPIHPLKVAEKKAQDEQAAKERAEKAKIAAAKKAQKEEDLKERSTAEFVAIKNGTHPLLGKRTNNNAMDKENAVDKENAAPVAKKQKGNNGVPSLSVPTSALLQRLNEEEGKRKEAIRNALDKKRNDFVLALKQKQSELDKEVDNDCHRLRTIIMSLGGNISKK